MPNRPPRPARDLDPEVSRPGLQLTRIQAVIARRAHPDRRWTGGEVPVVATCRANRQPDGERIVFATVAAARLAAAELARLGGLRLHPVECLRRPKESQTGPPHWHLQSRLALPFEPRDPTWHPTIHTREGFVPPIRTPLRPATMPAPLTTPRSSTR
jgi:hypothetical protein